MDKVDQHRLIGIVRPLLKDLFHADNFLAYLLKLIERVHGKPWALCGAEDVEFFVGVEIIGELNGVQNQSHQQKQGAHNHKLENIPDLLAKAFGGLGVENLERESTKVAQQSYRHQNGVEYCKTDAQDYCDRKVHEMAQK